MSSMQSKEEGHRNAWVRNEAEKLIKIKEAESIALLFRSDMEAKLKSWIEEEVKRQVAVYCEGVFSVPKEEYMSIKVDEVVSDEQPVESPILFLLNEPGTDMSAEHDFEEL